jgi:hypothetical protein
MLFAAAGVPGLASKAAATSAAGRSSWQRSLLSDLSTFDGCAIG